MRRSAQRIQETDELTTYLIGLLKERDPEILADMPEELPTVAGVSHRSAWLLARLAKTDPDGLDQLLASELESLDEPTDEEDFEWTQMVIQAMQRASWEANSSEPYQTDAQIATRFKYRPTPQDETA